ncbi:CheR family methyltransferase [Sphingomonas baiyangensis]|uniref:Protein-glutamate O-methyltransferase CheR n=1 Tax=Sphingomonas baiyangensis TaxID=2572576 RepID=A0A4V5PTQ1_9SPHN|nr:protein-glutamate O-methyltransferase CheR [Sphingomonas baiyangensis]TKD50898.1 protein-glutamate O-methyltransferase CheR [Sphingomonas baiyangensis]
MIAPVPADTTSAGARNVIAALLERHTGQQIGAGRAWRIDSALKPLLRAHGLDTLDQLAAGLLRDGDAALKAEVVDALLNQESSFFRDFGVIEQIGIAASQMQAAHPSRRLRLWSAGCSTGQEPLSIAMLLDEMHRDAPAPDICATDVSASAIQRARSGRFSQFEVQRGLAIQRMIRWFEPAGDDWVARPELLARVQFRRHNLVVDPALPGRFDIILCRNVLFYFSPPVRRQVFATLAGALRPGGVIVLGASETVIGQTDLLEPSTAYRGFYQARADTPLRASAHG